MRAVVTGGAGFIGSHLIEALVACRRDVVCVERRDASRRWIKESAVTYCDCGIHDIGQLTAAFDGADVVFHLAGLTAARSPAEFYDVHTEGTKCVLRAAARHGGSAPRVVLLSSIAAVGPSRNGELLSPDSEPHPISHYGRSKLLAEGVIREYSDAVPTTIVRLPTVYGPRDRAALTMFKLVSRGVALAVGRWDREFSLIYVKDLVQGLQAAAAHDSVSGRTYCLAHPEAVSWRGFASTAGAVLGRKPILVTVPDTLARVVAVVVELLARMRRRAVLLNRDRVREITQDRWVCDASRAIQEIGFEPTFPLARGAAETVAWYKQAHWL